MNTSSSQFSIFTWFNNKENKNTKTLHGYLSELLLCEVKRVIIGSDAMFPSLWTWWQARSQQAIVHHVDK